MNNSICYLNGQYLPLTELRRLIETLRQLPAKR